jgi:hypothetical protein
MSRWFISHGAQDRSFVETELLGLFEALGQQVWYAREDISSAEEWERTINGGLQLCDGFVLVLSPRSIQSQWVKQELAWALKNRPGQIIPLLIEPCAPDVLHQELSRIQHLDFVTNARQGRNQLISLVLTAEQGGVLSGVWVGTIRQHGAADEERMELSVEGSLTVQGNMVTGFGRVSVPTLHHWVGLNYTFNGLIHSRRFMQLDYVCKDQGRNQFGSMLLEIDPTGKKMIGKLVGFGAIHSTIGTGDVTVEKKT